MSKTSPETKLRAALKLLSKEKADHESTKSELTIAQAEIDTLKANQMTARQMAARMAVQIAAGQNTPAIGVPLNDKNVDGTPKTASILEEYASITDPKKRSEFRAKNADKLLAAARAQLKQQGGRD